MDYGLDLDYDFNPSGPTAYSTNKSNSRKVGLIETYQTVSYGHINFANTHCCIISTLPYTTKSIRKLPNINELIVPFID